MLDNTTKRRIDAARDTLVGKVPDPKSQVDQITIALIYKFMADMDNQAESIGGKRSFFAGDFEKYRWENLMSPRMGGHDMLNLYAEAIARMNQNPGIPQLFRDIFKNAFLPYRAPETLRIFLKIINDFQYDHSERLGDAFEYLLSVLGGQGKAGQFRTPRHIIDFMVDIIAPHKSERILDPACGTAGFLISAWKYINQTNARDGKPGAALTPDERKKLACNVFGYDISPDMVRLSLVNMYLHGFAEPHIYEYDALTSEDRWNETADVILANPPFMSPKGGIRPHRRFSIQANRSEVLFVDYIAEHLSSHGRAAVIVPEGIIFQSAKAYKQLRKMLVEKYLLAVVSLPAGAFNPYSPVKTSILFMDKSLAKKSSDVLFIKVENDGFDLGAKRLPIDKNDLPESAAQVKAYLHAVQNDAVQDMQVAPNALVVAKDKINESDGWDLSANLYRASATVRHSDWPMVELGVVCDTKRGTSITKKQVNAGDIPVIAGGQQPAYFHNRSNREGDIITVSGSGAYAGFVNYFQTPIFASDCTTIKVKEGKGITKFFYYLLKGMQEAIYALRKGMAQPHVYPRDLQRFEVPCPPLKIQQAIIAEIDGYQKIIDGARQVVENYAPRVAVDSDWSVVALGEVANVEAGNSAPQDKALFENGVHPFCRTSDVGKVHISSNFIEISDHLNDGGIAGLRLFKKGTILFPKSGASTFLNHRVILGKDSYVSSHLATIFANEDCVNGRFLFHILCNVDARSITADQNYPSLRLSSIKNIKIPLPPMEIQREIVAGIEEEEKMIHSNKVLIRSFERKIKSKIATVWGATHE